MCSAFNMMPESGRRGPVKRTVTTLPLKELKSRTSGYATFDYEEGGYRAAELQRLDIHAHGKAVDALARLVHKVGPSAPGYYCRRPTEELTGQLQPLTLTRIRSTHFASP